MPIVIGAKPESSFTDPLGMLSDCHRRIEMFLNVLVRLAEQGTAILSPTNSAAPSRPRYVTSATLRPSTQPMKRRVCFHAFDRSIARTCDRC